MAAASRALALALVLLLASPATAQVAEEEPVAAEAVSDEDFDRAFRRLKADRSIQFELPARDAAPERPPRRRWKWLEALFDFLAPLAKVVIYAAGGAVVLALVWFIVTSFADVRFRRKDSKGEPAPVLYEPGAARVRTLLEEVDALAREGRYREAVHLLLLRAVEDIDASRPGEVRRSLTAREIGRIPSLTPRTREAFVSIATINERGWFAGLTTDRAQWEAARAAYAQFGGEEVGGSETVTGATA